MEIKKITYTVRFVGPERFLVMKVLDREMRKSYHVYGGKLIKDTKDYAEMMFTIHEDPRVSFYDINSYVGSIARNFCLDNGTDWEIVSTEEFNSIVKVVG